MQVKQSSGIGSLAHRSLRNPKCLLQLTGFAAASGCFSIGALAGSGVFSFGLKAAVAALFVISVRQ